MNQENAVVDKEDNIMEKSNDQVDKVEIEVPHEIVKG